MRKIKLQKDPGDGSKKKAGDNPVNKKTLPEPAPPPAGWRPDFPIVTDITQTETGKNYKYSQGNELFNAFIPTNPADSANTTVNYIGDNFDWQDPSFKMAPEDRIQFTNFIEQDMAKKTAGLQLPDYTQSIQEKANGGEIKSNTMKKKAVKIKRKGYAPGTTIGGVQGANMGADFASMTPEQQSAYQLAQTQAEKDKIAADAKNAKIAKGIGAAGNAIAAIPIPDQGPKNAAYTQQKNSAKQADQAVTGIATAINPIVGGIIGGLTEVGQGIRSGVEETRADGTPVNSRETIEAMGMVGAFTDPMQGITALSQGITPGNYYDKMFGDAIKAKAQKDVKAAESDVNYVQRQSVRDGGEIGGDSLKTKKPNPWQTPGMEFPKTAHSEFDGMDKSNFVHSTTPGDTRWVTKEGNRTPFQEMLLNYVNTSNGKGFTGKDTLITNDPRRLDINDPEYFGKTETRDAGDLTRTKFFEMTYGKQDASTAKNPDPLDLKYINLAKGKTPVSATDEKQLRFISKAQNKADGGIIEGKGTKTSDSINAEFNLKDQIINADAMENNPAAKAVMKHLGLNKKAKLKNGTVPVKVSDGEGHIPAKDVPDAEAYLASIGSSLRQLNPNAEENVQAFSQGSGKKGVLPPGDKYYLADNGISVFTKTSDYKLKPGERELDLTNPNDYMLMLQEEDSWTRFYKGDSKYKDEVAKQEAYVNELRKKLPAVANSTAQTTPAVTPQQQAIQNAVAATPAVTTQQGPVIDATSIKEDLAAQAKAISQKQSAALKKPQAAPSIEPAQWKYDEFKKNYGTDKAAITKLQQELVDKNYNLGTTGPKKNGVDGNLGDKTETAFISNNVKGPDVSIGSLIQQDALNTSNANKAIGAKFPPEPVEPDGRSASYDAAILAEQAKPHQTNDVNDAQAALEAAALKEKAAQKSGLQKVADGVGGVAGALALAQLGLGLEQTLLGKRPKGQIDTTFLSRVGEALKSEKQDMPGMTAALNKLDLGRKALTNYATSTAGGNSGQAYAMAKDAAGQEASGVIDLATKNAMFKLQQKSRTDALSSHLAGMKRQLFEDDLTAFKQNQTAGADLAQAGIANFVGNRQYKDAQDRMDARLAKYGTTGYSAPTYTG